jgi:hypothetical protein
MIKICKNRYITHSSADDICVEIMNQYKVVARVASISVDHVENFGCCQSLVFAIVENYRFLVPQKTNMIDDCEEVENGVFGCLCWSVRRKFMTYIK